MKRIEAFDGEYRWLSNFWPVRIAYDGYVWSSVEQAYQAAKFNDSTKKQAIQTCKAAGDAKRMGRGSGIRTDWEDVKEQVMLDLLRLKFKDVYLSNKLLATGDAYIVEGNYWGDTYWGVCRSVGLNRLGVLLMQVRRELTLQGMAKGRVR